MDAKLEFELNQKLEKPSFTKIHQKAMAIFREVEEGTEVFEKVKELIDTIEKEQSKMDDLKGMMYLIASKM
ncbi:hypothetical protein [Alkaliphilus sp. B6464]|uniref:hypothetical protein n=1 Tax=Alkaliphilus sp. B6464 TaxID=2731219 RepID=UPI001BAB5785|nr:hypothetical protein [Alkaliphilus sp. B6464]QUH21777.1 hypothetical protein HYG84_17730 [Alkaliphilus sp. B6464]